jgi:hypothetical protein
MTQSDNLQSSPDVEEAVTGTQNQSLHDPGEFFAALDQAANGGVVDERVPPQQTTSKESSSPVAEATESGELETLKKRYSDSSREAKRLNQRNSELEQYAPLLDRMREDPQLISTVRNYIDGKKQQGFKDRLGVSEDFVFDPDEAFSDPNSESAKVFNSVVDDKVQKIVNGRMQQQQNGQRIEKEQDEFRKKHNMDDAQFNEFMEFAKSRPLSYDDIYYLMNRDSRDTTIATETRREVASQMANVRQKPQSQASSGTQGNAEETVEDAIFDTMLNEGLDNLWNN